MSWINLTALWKIVVFGLIAGAGLPALFAGGLYSLSLGPRLRTANADGTTTETDGLIGGSVIGMVLAAIAFLIVLAAIGWGIYEVYQIGHPAVAKK
jgi:cation transporter-like permease